MRSAPNKANATIAITAHIMPAKIFISMILMISQYFLTPLPTKHNGDGYKKPHIHM